MNDDRMLERRVATVYEETAPPREPQGLLDDVLLATSRSRQRPRWLSLIKEPPMRTSNSLAVGSPMSRVTAIVVATLLLAVALAAAGVAGSRLLAADDGPIVVAQDGSGDYRTISEAVAAADEGDEIMVMTGVYPESIVVTKDITIAGHPGYEDAEDVFIEFGRGCLVKNGEGDYFSAEDQYSCGPETPVYPTSAGAMPYGVLLDNTDGEIRDLAFRPAGDGGMAIIVNGGAPRISNIYHVSIGDIGGLYVHGGSSAIIAEANLTDHWVLLDDSPATIERSTFEAIVANASEGATVTIRDNSAVGIAFNGPALIEGNTLVADPGHREGVFRSVIMGRGGDDWIISDNSVFGYRDVPAIGPAAGSSGTISGNTLADNKVGIHLEGGESLVEGNIINNGEDGIVVLSGSPRIIDNSVSGLARRGFSIGGSPVLRGNRSCGNGQDLFVRSAATPDIDDSNEFCEDATAE